MFVYQGKINNKDALIIVGQTQDEGTQVPPTDSNTVVAVYENEENTLVIGQGHFKDGEFIPEEEPQPVAPTTARLDADENGLYLPQQFDVDYFDSALVQIPPPTADSLFVITNGDYSPSTFGVDYFSDVTVDVPWQPTAVSLDVTENGVYYPSSYEVDYFDYVTVDVSGQPTAVPLDVTENGVYYPSSYEVDYFSDVTVDVPTPASISLDVTENGVYSPSSYEVDYFDNVTVDVPALDVYSGNIYISASILGSTERVGDYTGDLPLSQDSNIEVNVDTDGYLFRPQFSVSTEQDDHGLKLPSTLYINTGYDISQELAELAYSQRTFHIGVQEITVDACYSVLTNIIAVDLSSINDLLSGYAILFSDDNGTPNILYSTTAFDLSSMIPGLVVTTPGWQVTSIRSDNFYVTDSLESNRLLFGKSLGLSSLYGIAYYSVSFDSVFSSQKISFG